MTNKTRLLSNSYVFLLTIIISLTSLSVLGQDLQNGTWKAKIDKKNSEKIYFSFSRENTFESTDKKGNKKTRKNKYSFSGSDFKISEFQGLSINQINSSKTQVSFSLIRDAGTIQMIGSFENGKGKGTWTFSPDASFVSAMESYGFNNISDEKLFASTILNVRTQTVSELKSAGLNNLDYEDIFKATIFKVDSDYIREMSNAGFNNLDMEDLVKARIFKIDAKYAREILALGFGEQSMEKLVQFRIFKITPEFLNDMKAEGLSNLSAGNLVQLRIFKINGEFIRKARENGYANPTVDELVELKINGKLK